MKYLFLFFMIAESSFASDPNCLQQIDSFLEKTEMGSFKHPKADAKESAKSGYVFRKGKDYVTVFHPNQEGVTEITFRGSNFWNSPKMQEGQQTHLKLDINCKIHEFISPHLSVWVGPKTCNKTSEQLLKEPLMTKEKLPKVKEICGWLYSNNMLPDNKEVHAVKADAEAKR